MSDAADDTPAEFPPADQSYFQHIETFVEIRCEGYLQQAAVNAVQFFGRGDVNRGRREFLRLANEVYDNVSEDYQTRSYMRIIKKRGEAIRARRAAAAAAPAEPTETTPPKDPEPTPES